MKAIVSSLCQGAGDNEDLRDVRNLAHDLGGNVRVDSDGGLKGRQMRRFARANRFVSNRAPVLKKDGYERGSARFLRPRVDVDRVRSGQQSHLPAETRLAAFLQQPGSTGRSQERRGGYVRGVSSSTAMLMKGSTGTKRCMTLSVPPQDLLNILIVVQNLI